MSMSPYPIANFLFTIIEMYPIMPDVYLVDKQQ